MSDSYPDHHDLNEGQWTNVRTNILSAEKYLDEMLDVVVDHLEDTNMNCVRCCIGDMAGQEIYHADPVQNQMVLIMAVRRLAEQRLGETALTRDYGPSEGERGGKS